MKAMVHNCPDLVEQYEALRREASSCEAPRGHGLALFVARGMTAWMAASRAVVMQRVEPAPQRADVGVPCGHAVVVGERGRLSSVLASMVLVCVEGEEMEK